MGKKIKNWGMSGCEGRFYVRGKKDIIWYRRGTQRISTKLEYSGTNKILAQEKVQNIELNRVEGKQLFTVIEAYKFFLEQTASTKSKGTLRLYNIAIRQLLTTNNRINNYAAIRQEIAENLTKLTTSNQTKNASLAKVSAFFQYFIDYEYIEKNPVTKKMYLKIVEKPIETYDTNELKMIFDCLQKETLDTYIYFKVLYYCAFRRDELAQIRWEQVVDENGKFRENIIIPLSKYKNKVDKFPLTEELEGYFNEIGVQQTGKIFRHSSDSYYKVLKKILKTTGIVAKTQWRGYSLGIHTLRKTRISEWLFSEKLPIQVVSMLSRDNIQTVMKFYAKLSSEQLHDYL